MNQVVFSHNCSNCGSEVNHNDKFCNQCGQKQPLNKLSFKEVLSDMWLVMTNIDNAFFRTLRDIWRPWTLTQRYIQGQRKKYINPFRFFFVLLLIYVGLLISQVDWNKIISSDVKFKVGGIPLNTNLINDYTISQQLDSLRNNVDKLKSKYSQNDSLFYEIDSIFLKFRSLELKDSIFKTTLNNKPYEFEIVDVFNMDIDSVYKKYEVTTFLDKLLTKQTFKAIKNPIGVIKVWFGNLTWMIVLTLIILGLFFKLLYYRQNKPYIEHIVFLANIHSLSFLINILLIISFRYFSDFTELLIIVPILIFILSTYIYYKNNLFKSLLKAFISALIYFTFFTFSLAIVALTSFFIF